MAEPIQLKVEFMERQNIPQNTPTYEPLREDSKISQILQGIFRGTGLIHAIPSSIASRTENSDPNLRDSPLEKLSAGLTVLAEGVAYLVLARNGIPAYYIPAVTNAIDTLGLGLYYRSNEAMLNRIEENIHNMING